MSYVNYIHHTPTRKRWAIPIVRVLEAACSLTRHWGGCRMLQYSNGWPTARLYAWAYDLAFPTPEWVPVEYEVTTSDNVATYWWPSE